MSLETACSRIMGDELAVKMIADMGLRWTIVAAVAEARKSDDPEALAELTKYIDAQKR